MATVIENWNACAVNRRKKTEPQIPHVSNILADGMWENYPAVVLGGGPSLGPLLPRLKEFPALTRFVAVNQAWRITDPYPTVAFALDRQVFDMAEREYPDEWKSKPNQVRITGRSNATKGRWFQTYWVHATSDWGTTLGADVDNPQEGDQGVLSGNNSGICGINVATILGASPIILLGFDGMAEGKKINYHDDYPPEAGWQPRHPGKHWEKWKRMFENMREKITATVYNANPDTILDVFEKVTFEQAVKLCQAVPVSL